MRRGGRLLIVLGIVVAAVAALLGYLVLQGQSISNPQPISQATAVPVTRQVVSALIDIPNNTVLTETETFLTLTDIPETQFNASPNDYFTNFSELQNKLTLRSIPVNDIIRKADVIDAGLSLKIPTPAPNEPRPKAYPFQVNNLTGVADQIQPGDFVDVLASFEIKQTIIRPGVNDEGQPQLVEQEFIERSTKTLVQNVQVLQIQRPQLAPEGTPTPGPSGPPESDESGQPVGTSTEQTPANTLRTGNWVLLLAVTDQEAEIIKFSLENGLGVTLVLRGRGDTAVETTNGVTQKILVSQFGLPVPDPFLDEPTDDQPANPPANPTPVVP